MKKRIAAILLCLCMLLAALAGCGGGSYYFLRHVLLSGGSSVGPSAAGAGEESAADEAAAGEEAAEPITLTVMNRIPESYRTKGNPVLDAIAERTGVTLDIRTLPMSNYNERFQVVLTSGELCDISYTWGFRNSLYQKGAADGLFWELDGLIDRYPNLRAIPNNQWESARVPETGKIYAVPRPSSESVSGVIANQQWLDALADGRMPETAEELYAYALRVAKEDPDGDGKDDTWLFSPVGIWSDRWIVQAFLPHSGSSAVYLPDYDGTYKIREKMDGYLPYLEFLRRLYTEGLMDPEFYLNNTYDDRTCFSRQETAFCSGFAGLEASLIVGFGEEGMPVSEYDQYAAYYPNMKGPGQERPVDQHGAAHWGGWVISSGVDEAVRDRILEFLDWSNSEEGWLLWNAGREGEDYLSYDPRTKTVIRTQEQEKNNYCVGYASPAAAREGEQLTFVVEGDQLSLDRARYTAHSHERALALSERVEVPVVSAPKLSSWEAGHPGLAEKKAEMEERFVMGEIEKAEFLDFMEREFYPAIAEAEEEYIEVMEAYEKRRG